MEIQENVISWILGLKGWQSELAYMLLTKGDVIDSDIDTIVSMIKNGDPFVVKEFPIIINTTTSAKIIFKSIGKISNIEQLSPRIPLEFADVGLTVVYGNNGTGKSGYTRILKRITGKPRARALMHNIYKKDPSCGKCEISYSIDGIDRSLEWLVTAPPVPELTSIDIYDAETGISYLKDSNHITYTPMIILFFAKMVESYDYIKQLLASEVMSLVSNLPTAPKEYTNSTFIINYQSSNIDITKFTWTAEDEEKYKSLEELLKEVNPKLRANELRGLKNKLKTLISELNIQIKHATQGHCDRVLELKSDLDKKDQILKDAGNVLGKTVKLDGVGSSSWKALWNAAKEFSVSEAYKLDDTPLSDNKRCVLCHQVLNEEAHRRMHIFEDFVSSKLANDYERASRIYKEAISNLPISIQKEDVDNKGIAAGLDKELREIVYDVLCHVRKNGESIKNGDTTIIDITDITGLLISKLEEEEVQYETKALMFDGEVEGSNRGQAEIDILELSCRKWCFEQLDSIKIESERQSKIKRLNSWISQTNTRAITQKVNEIAELVITQEYIIRFNEELIKLGATKIKVEIATKPGKGAIIHTVRIVGVDNINPIEVLSEGEMRIISLAAFIADVTGGNNCNPFIFDDPISSLDQGYEENVVKRLVELSASRQVIVFTHRLSLLGQLHDTCGELYSVGIRKEPWGAGEITNIPLFAKKPNNALSGLKNQEVQQAKNIHNESGHEAYYPFGKMLCSDIRILIERIVEVTFLADVVQRHRRAINTKGKVNNLIKITSEDCTLIDRFMTKYSSYEHSQSDEAPIEIPDPAEIERDLDEILIWHQEFSKRKIE